MGSAMAEAKGKIRKRHGEAIEEWLDWCRKNPKAGKHRSFQMFDAMVDSAALKMELDRGVREEKVRAG